MNTYKYTEPTLSQYLHYLTTLQDFIATTSISPYICNAKDKLRRVREEQYIREGWKDCEIKLMKTVQKKLDSQGSTVLYFTHNTDIPGIAPACPSKDADYTRWVRETRCYYLSLLIQIYSRKYKKIHGVEWTLEERKEQV